MVGESSGGTPDQSSMRGTQDELLLQAAAVLRRRYEEGERHAELPPLAAAELGDVLAGLVTAQHAPEGVDRDEALSLAHRLIDDDHPELSPMWPPPSG